MNITTAFRYILSEWVFLYHEDGLASCLYQMFLERPPEEFRSKPWQAAKVVVFGTYSPSDEQINEFIDKFGDWMLELYESRHELMAGEKSMDALILKMSIAETWDNGSI